MQNAILIGGRTVPQLVAEVAQVIAALQSTAQPSADAAALRAAAGQYAVFAAEVPDPAERCQALMKLAAELATAVPTLLPSKASAFDALATILEILGDAEAARHLVAIRAAGEG
jgi:hypothetical protein